MPTAPGRPCRYPRCPVIGPCAAHDGLQLPDWKGWYCTARWRRRRKYVLDADPLCVECRRAGVVTLATEVDHIIPHHGDPGLFWPVQNLQGLCDTHHSQKTRSGQ